MGKATKIKIKDTFQGEAPTPEHIAKGETERRYVTHVDTQTITMAHISSHSPVQRWKRAERLSDTQIAAITLCEALWAKTELRQKLTASYGERTPMGADNEWIAVHEIQARKDLARIEGYCVPWQWDAFENIVRWGETAGTAGASLGFTGSKGAQAAMLMLVRMVADQIAREERLT